MAKYHNSGDRLMPPLLLVSEIPEIMIECDCSTEMWHCGKGVCVWGAQGESDTVIAIKYYFEKATSWGRHCKRRGTETLRQYELASEKGGIWARSLAPTESALYLMITCPWQAAIGIALLCCFHCSAQLKIRPGSTRTWKNWECKPWLHREGRFMAWGSLKTSKFCHIVEMPVSLEKKKSQSSVSQFSCTKPIHLHIPSHAQPMSSHHTWPAVQLLNCTPTRPSLHHQILYQSPDSLGNEKHMWVSVLA